MNDFENLPFDDEVKSEYSELPLENQAEVPQLMDNNILIFDDRIKDIPAQNTKVSFKKTSIVFPVIAFIFVSILGMYLFVNNSKADTVNLIRIEENNKFGYIDNDGTIITRCKYISGSEYYKGYAIVKNNNNLYGVLDGKGVLEVPFGNYYYIGLFGNKYIASKITNNGLKQALLDSKLNEVTKFKYDTISYARNGMYLFIRDDTMGILNKEGKEIYTFKVDEIDDKNIDIEISNVTENLPLEERYAKVKVNDSSTIINLSTGKEVYSYTLSDINVLDNNVFYINSKDDETNNTYIVIHDSEVKYKTNKYKRVKVEDYNSNIALGINSDTSIDYINLLTQKVINSNENNNYYYSDGVVLEKSHDFNSNKDIYNIISSRKIEGTFRDYRPVDNLFKNNYLDIELHDGKYNYVNKTGNLVNDKSYDSVSSYDNNGYAIVSNDDKYGVIDKDGKEVIPLAYAKIEFLEEDFSSFLSKSYNKELFLYKDENNNYGVINSKNKIIVEAAYDKIEYISDKYPILLVSYLNDKLLLNLSTGKELPIKISSNKIEVKENCIIINQEYYNYSGKIIYTAK